MDPVRPAGGPPAAVGETTRQHIMKHITLAILTVAAAAFVGCNPQKAAIDNSAETRKSAIDDRKAAVDAAAIADKKQADVDATVEKAKIDAKKAMDQAQLDADKQKADARAALEKAKLDAEKK